MSATTDQAPGTPDPAPEPAAEPQESVRRRRAARPKSERGRLGSTGLIYLVLVGVIAVSVVLTGIEGQHSQRGEFAIGRTREGEGIRARVAL